MKILIILGHPNPESFNHAIANTAAETLKQLGHSVILHDLYAEGFDPNLPATELVPNAAVPDAVEVQSRELSEADGLIVVHPNWWAQPPAILKGWLDRVIRPGVAYRFGPNEQGEIGPIGLLKVKTAIAFNTSNTPKAKDEEIYGDPLDNLWKTCIFGFCGIKDARRVLFDQVIVSSPEQRAGWLQQVKSTCHDAFPA